MNRLIVAGAFAIGGVGGFVLARNFGSEAVIACEPLPTAPAAPIAQTREPAAALVAVPVEVPIETGLAAPKFRQEGPIHSTQAGYVLVRWEPVAGASGYAVQVLDPASGDVAREYLTHHNYSFLRDLEVDAAKRETLYSVQVTPIGPAGRRGPASAWKEVAVLRAAPVPAK